MLAAHDFTPVLRKHKSVAIALWGEAGVGKTYAAAHLLKSLPCLTLSLHATTPLSRLAATLPTPKKLAAWAGRTLERLEHGEPLGTAAAVDAAAATLAGLAPFVLHLEDMHEADGERNAFIYNLARSVQTGKGVGLLVTSRARVDEPFIAVKLEPLAPEVSEQLLEAELRAPIPKEAASWIYRKAAGNPLYTLEYVRFLARQGFLWNDGRDWHWREPQNDLMPATVEALIEVQLAKVDAEFERALHLKAMLPVEADDELWSRGLGANAQTFEPIKSALNESGVMRGSSFVHPLYREVILKTLPKTKRQALARVLLEVCADDPACIATFIAEAGLEREAALSLLHRAAERAKTAGDEVLTGNLLARAADYAVGVEKAELIVQAALIVQHYDLAEAVRLVEALLDREPENIKATYLGILLYARDRQADKVKQTLAKLPQRERESQRGVEAAIEAFGFLTDADATLELWDAHKHLDLRTDLIPRLAFVLLGKSRVEEAKRLIQTRLEHPDLTVRERPGLLHALATLYVDVSQHSEAEVMYGQVLDCAEQLGLGGVRERFVYFNRAIARKFLGNYQKARQDALEAQRLCTEAGDSYMLGRALGLLAEITTELGDYGRAEEYFGESLKLLQQKQVLSGLVDINITASALYAAWRGPYSAVLGLKHSRQALKFAEDLGDQLLIADALHAAASAEVAFGDPSEALRFAEELQLLADQHEALSGYYEAVWSEAAALGATGRVDKAKAQFQKALEHAQQAGHLVNAQKLGLELDRLNGDMESARVRMVWFEAHGLMNGVNIAKRYFPKLADPRDQPPAFDHAPRLDVLGPMHISHKGTSEVVRGSKRQELLAFLLEARLAGLTEVSRLELLDAVYPGEDERNAVQNLKTLVHGLRTYLGASSVTTTATGYALGALTSDAEAFLHARDTKLWRGPYLEGGVIEGRETVRESLYLALAEKAKALLETDPKEVARVSKTLLEYDPYSLEYLSLCLRALRAERNHKSLVRIYNEAKTRFAEVGESLPDTWRALLT